MSKTTLTISQDWKFCYEENIKCKSYADSINKISDLDFHGFSSYKANVPGSFILDLYDNGIIDDPLYSTNMWKLQKYEAMHVWYYTDFEYKFTENDVIVFNGLDTCADVFLDGKLILKASNMFVGYEISNDMLNKEIDKHELLIHFSPAVIKAREYKTNAQSNCLWYNYQSLYIRKSAHMFGWDILPRLVSCGIWKPIEIVNKPEDRINDVYIYTLYTKPDIGVAKIRVYSDISISSDLVQEYTFRLKGKCGDSEFCEEITPWGLQYSRMAFEIKDAKLWWPRGYGEQNLYECEAELIKDGIVLDTYKLKIGLRTVNLQKSEAVIDGDGQFLFKINNTPIFCKGCNWSPLTPFPSESEKLVDIGLERLLSTNSNIVRIWGGGTYGSDRFYEFCDEHGILVWQDFMMACAVHPQTETFFKSIEEEAEYNIIRLRNHPSLALWSGDNECDCTYNSWGGVIRNPNENEITRTILPSVIRKHDLTTPYLPSSPYLSETCFVNNYSSPEDHLWGARPSYESDYYSKTKCIFVSEIGHHGAVAPVSAKEFIPDDELYPIVDENGDVRPSWLAHASETMIANETPYKYRMKMLVNKVQEYLGYIPDNYNDFALYSQIIHAEAVKRFIEIFRKSKWDKTGFIYWNLTDGFGISCESVIDYYGRKKIAFYYMKTAYEPVYVMIGENDGKFNLYISNDTLKSFDVKYTIKTSSGEIVYSGEYKIDENRTDNISELNIDKNIIYFIEWNIDGVTYKSHYLYNLKNINMDEYFKIMKKENMFFLEGF